MKDSKSICNSQLDDKTADEITTKKTLTYVKKNS